MGFFFIHLSQLFAPSGSIYMYGTRTDSHYAIQSKSDKKHVFKKIFQMGNIKRNFRQYMLWMHDHINNQGAHAF